MSPLYHSPAIPVLSILSTNCFCKHIYKIKIGKFPFTASGKATAAGQRDGFVKLIFDEDSERLLGAHMVGMNVTEMIAEPTLAKKLGATAHILARTIHSHPTMNEAVMEAAEAATGAAIHL